MANRGPSSSASAPSASRSEAGFTLVELVLALTISSILLGGIGILLGKSIVWGRENVARDDFANQLTVTRVRFNSDARSASAAAVPLIAIGPSCSIPPGSVAGTPQLIGTFTTDLYQDPYAPGDLVVVDTERVEYFLADPLDTGSSSGNSLWRVNCRGSQAAVPRTPTRLISDAVLTMQPVLQQHRDLSVSTEGLRLRIETPAQGEVTLAGTMI